MSTQFEYRGHKVEIRNYGPLNNGQKALVPFVDGKVGKTYFRTIRRLMTVVKQLIDAEEDAK